MKRTLRLALKKPVESASLAGTRPAAAKRGVVSEAMRGCKGDRMVRRGGEERECER